MPELPPREIPYLAYSYSYPHKTAYRPLRPRVPLGEVWVDEPKDSLFLYLHVPFCEMRCGFCNLFTTTNPAEEFTTLYLGALTRQAHAVRDAFGDACFSRIAIGGGTPTYLETTELETLFKLLRDVFGIKAGAVPTSVETSPATAQAEKLQLLREYGVSRISIGIQSFVETEVAAVGRSQRREVAEAALERIRQANFPILNIDLIYGLPCQTLGSWKESIQAALRFEPEEIYLYPLYVRPLTGLQRMDKAWDDLRLALYREGRDLLVQAGYSQFSMRMFQKRAIETRGPVYCCQEDGMVGLGCGARSYTRWLHYSTEFAVGARGVREILADYVARPAADFGFADHGFELDLEDQRRRYVIQSLLQKDGLGLGPYTARFGSSAMEDLPQLPELIESGLAVCREERLQLCEMGLEYSDSIGPRLYSPKVRSQMESYKLR